MICTSFRDFNLHIPRRRWQTSFPIIIVTSYFNPHLPHRRWPTLLQSRPHLLLFQSTPSSQKVTSSWYRWRDQQYISIHTFLTEGDFSFFVVTFKMWYFNPHLPHRRWPHTRSNTAFMNHFNPHLPHRRWHTIGNVGPIYVVFQSTPSSQKVTCWLFYLHWRSNISIHTFLTEGDHSTCSALQHTDNFNPHLPHRRWPI